METKLNKILKKIFSKFKGNFTDKLTSKSIPQWDSLNHLNLIMEVSKQFKIKFEFNEIININSIGDLKKRIKNKIV